MLDPKDRVAVGTVGLLAFAALYRARSATLPPSLRSSKRTPTPATAKELPAKEQDRALSARGKTAR